MKEEIDITKGLAERYEGMKPKLSNFGGVSIEDSEGMKVMQEFLDKWWEVTKPSYFEFFKKELEQTYHSGRRDEFIEMAPIFRSEGRNQTLDELLLTLPENNCTCFSITKVKDLINDMKVKSSPTK